MRNVLLLLLLLLPSAAWGTTYYVSTSGNDSNSCSAAQSLNTPKRNPSNGAGCLGPGDTLHIRAGTYNVGTWNGPPSGNSNARVTVAGYPQDGTRQAILNLSGNGNGVNLGSGSTWITFDNLVFQGSQLTSSVIKLTSAQNIRITNSEVTGGGTQGIHLVTNASNNVIGNNFIHDNGSTTRDHGIYSEAPNNIYENNEIYAHVGLGIHNYHEPDRPNTNNISRGNYIHHNGYGLLLSHGDNQKAYNNVIYHNDNYGFQNYESDNSLILNNTVYQNGGPAFDINASAIICNNIALNNGNNSASGGSTDSNNTTSGSVAFVNAGAADFHLTASATNVINQGTSGCQVSTYVTTDKDGNARPVNGAWDRGAYEFGGSGGPVCPAGCTCTQTAGVCDCPAGCTCTTPGVCDIAPPPPGLQAYWPFDHSSGTTATDATPNGHTMTFTGGPSWVPGRVGSNAIEFTTATQVGNAQSFDFTTSYSWAGWFKMRTAPRTDVFEICLGYGGPGDQFEWVWSSSVAGGDQAATHRNSSGGYQRARVTTPLQPNTWYHVAATWNGTTLIAYLNGTQQASTAVSGMQPGGDNTFQMSFSGKACPGAVDDLRLYNTVLTPAEVQALAGTQAPAAVIVRHRALVR
jgi:Concanavalin A-like lectin/glucanases superfamily/Right handed beta helix region